MLTTYLLFICLLGFLLGLTFFGFALKVYKLKLVTGDG